VISHGCAVASSSLPRSPTANHNSQIANRKFRRFLGPAPEHPGP
jgi:hypothetical protein